MSTIDIQSFCEKDDIRSYLMTPIVITGKRTSAVLVSQDDWNAIPKRPAPQLPD